MTLQFLNRIDRRILVGLGVLALLLGALLFFGGAGVRPKAADKPRLILMSSISLQWGEAGIGDIAKGEAKASPLFAHLSQANRTVLIDDFQQLGQPGSAPLLLVQPRALAPRELVELDSWIRRGGSAVIFADPALDWPSTLPLGDPRRPLFTSLLTPMFKHWGLELALPVSEEAVMEEVIVGEYRLAPKSAGIWLRAKGNAAAVCAISGDELMAYCKVGKGRALLVTDADLLHEERWTDSVMTSGTTAWLDAVIKASGKNESLPATLWEN
jgi:hypothetical protein